MRYVSDRLAFIVDDGAGEPVQVDRPEALDDLELVLPAEPEEGFESGYSEARAILLDAFLGVCIKRILGS